MSWENFTKRFQLEYSLPFIHFIVTYKHLQEMSHKLNCIEFLSQLTDDWLTIWIMMMPTPYLFSVVLILAVAYPLYKNGIHLQEKVRKDQENFCPNWNALFSKLKQSLYGTWYSIFIIGDTSIWPYQWFDWTWNNSIAYPVENSLSKHNNDDLLFKQIELWTCTNMMCCFRNFTPSHSIQLLFWLSIDLSSFYYPWNVLISHP